ncbi:M55 family metallopeptidase [Tissierella sp. P1]|uniref:M55 family metallopeptidase n=1 Tax=Tissierella sp. P1 TaxID=1280483 RepID=UPI000B9FC7BA|nr:M55 family metallopeptidase [Tissierella sp. P1]
MKKQLILIADMEGASGIFESNVEAIYHGSNLWRDMGRQYLTSDVLAVCEAATECGIDEILLYDGHYAGDAEFNVIIEQLPNNVRIFDTPNRCFDWRRIRGQAESNPFGLITVGQHARNGEPWAYFPHTIQTPPIKSLFVNKMHIAEIGQGTLSFCGTKYLANIGCHASHKEAKEISENVTCITVKNKATGWEPSPIETYQIIKSGVMEAIRTIDKRDVISIGEPCDFYMELTEGYYFAPSEVFPWKGNFTETTAKWESPDIEIGLELFNYVRGFIKKKSK